MIFLRDIPKIPAVLSYSPKLSNDFVHISDRQYIMSTEDSEKSGRLEIQGIYLDLHIPLNQMKVSPPKTGRKRGHYNTACTVCHQKLVECHHRFKYLIHYLRRKTKCDGVKPICL